MRNHTRMGIFKNIFTWWEGATFGTALSTQMNGERVGSDDEANIYYQSRKAVNGKHRRWVMYFGANDASRVPPEWHGWLHHTHDTPPETRVALMEDWDVENPQRVFVNPTGTASAYRPAGAPESGGKRARATGDYAAWSPDA
jgi:NADH:ubiquinone oxidoreductase subunit